LVLNIQKSYCRALLQVQNITIDVVPWAMKTKLYKRTFQTAPRLLNSENPKINKRSVKTAVIAVRRDVNK
jgi:hypothetical protein